MLSLLFIVRYGNEGMDLSIYYTIFFFSFFLSYFFFFFYKSLHTTQMTPHSSLRRRQKDLYWYPWNLALPRSRDTLLTETAPVKKDLHVTSSLLSSGDEVANNRGIDSSNVSLMLVGNRVRRNRIQTSVSSKLLKKKQLCSL